jgi:hypothetical protein
MTITAIKIINPKTPPTIPPISALVSTPFWHESG